MALPINIEDLIRRRVVENARVEFWRDWEPEPILHSICAFANDMDNRGGGYILVGVEEENGMPKFPITGLNKSSLDRINKELLTNCTLIEPVYLPRVEQTQFDGKEILVVWAPGGAHRPYQCPVHFAADEKACYIRKLSRSVRANQAEEKELLSLAGDIPFDDRVHMRARITDIRSSLLSEYLSRTDSALYQDSLTGRTQDVAAAMHLVGGSPEMSRPLNVGLLFFNECPDKFFRYARIEVVDKPNPTGEGMTEQIFAGPLDKQLRDALSYIQNYSIRKKIFKIENRAEADVFFNYPYVAVKEALSNAVCHKSYQIGAPITVSITPDKMEITSFPGPDRTITDEDLQNGKLVAKRNRNRRIGDLLQALHLVEGRQTGISTILRAMAANGSPPPVFETDAERSYLTVILPVHAAFLKSSPKVDAKEGAQKKSRKKKEHRRRRSRSELKACVLDMLRKQGALSTSEIVARLGYSFVSPTLRDILKELLAENLVAYTVPDKKNSRNQKLRLV